MKWMSEAVIFMFDLKLLEYLILAVWPWASFWTFLYLHFFICRMGTVIASILRLLLVINMLKFV